jgi:predicted permease
MRSFRAWLLRLGELFRKDRRERDLAAELESHLQMHIEDNLRAGMSAAQARREAFMKLGGVEQTKENYRERRGLPVLETLLQDVRYGARTLRKNSGFTLLAVLTLTLGIGANTAIFSLINALMLRTLPVQDPGQLVELLHSFPGEPQFNGFSGEAFELMRDNNHVFSGLIAANYQPLHVRVGNSEPQTAFGGFVAGNFFQVLGLQPTLGRFISPQDDRSAEPSAVAVLSWSYWKNRFDLDPAILGKQIIVENVPVAVVGVTPRGFLGLSSGVSQDVWLPLAIKSVMHRSVLGWGSLALVGRLKPGVSIEQARAEMAVLFHSTIQAPNANPFLRNMKFDLQPAGTGLTSPLRQQFSTPMLVLMAIVSLLLLIACTNLATLLLARGAARQHEMALRIALGASRLRLVRLVLIEPLLLSVIGGMLAIVLAYFGAGALVRIMLSGQPRRGLPPNFEIQVHQDSHVLLFAVAATLLAALLSGFSPALRAFGNAPASALRQAGSAGESRFRRFFGRSLVVAQVALSVVLLSSAALFAGYLSKLEHLNLGFRRDHLLLVTLDASQSGYEDAQLSRLYPELLERLGAIPGVRSATLSEMTPISGSARACYCVRVEGREEKIENLHDMVFFNSVAPNYFKTYSTPLLAGRDFTVHDQNGPRSAIINQTMADYYFGDRSPIGKHLTFERDDKPYEIIGVVGDAKYNDIREAPPHIIYLDTFQEERPSSRFTLRTALEPQAVDAEVRQIVRSSLPAVQVARVTTMADQVDASIVPERLIVTLSGWFAALGALLVAIGLYGLLSYTVARRISEIGVRMALGATRSNVIRMVLGDALVMVCAGLLIGAPLAFWGKRIAMSLIQDLSDKNSISIILGAAAMLAIAVLAAYLPARRAARVDPMVALRYE